MRRKTWLQKAVLVGCMMSQVVACTSWRVESIAPAQVVTRSHPKKMRLRLLNGERPVVLGPAIEGDSLRGSIKSSDDRHAWGLDAIQGVSTRHVDAAKTAGLGLILLAVTALLASADWSAPAWTSGSPGPTSW